MFLSLLLHEVYLFTEAKPVVNYMLLDMQQEISSQGGQFIVLRIPTRNQFNTLNSLRRRLMNYEVMLGGSGVMYLDPTLQFMEIDDWQAELYWRDGHLNAVGNQLLADYVIHNVFED